MTRPAPAPPSRSRTPSFDNLANWLFDTSAPSGKIREGLFSILFIIIWLGLGLSLHLSLWQINWLDVIAGGLPKVISVVIGLLWNTFFAWDVLGPLVAILLPFMLALQFASTYLADIFELKQTSIARRFITQAAFADPDYLVLHIEEGSVRRADRKSPMAVIGGPGYVQINLENVAVFDTVEGPCKIVGPTSAEPHSMHVLNGFERLRQVVDLREHSIKFDVVGRTRDGIRIAIQDIRLLFSIKRDPSASKIGPAYSFDRFAVYNLIFRLGYQVDIEPWTNAMQTLVSQELINFISEYNLGELLAAVEDDAVKIQIERDALRQRSIFQLRRYRYQSRPQVWNSVLQQVTYSHHQRRDIVSAKQQLKLLPKPNPLGPKPAVIITSKKREYPQKWSYHFLPKLYQKLKSQRYAPRTQLSSLFYTDFTRSFPKRAHQEGVRLEWINVGTWHPLADLVLSQHKEAFSLTVDNGLIGNPRVIEKLKIQSRNQEVVRLIRQTPLYSLLALTKEQLPTPEIVYRLIFEYSGKLRAAISSLKEQGKPVPIELLNAVRAIEIYQKDYLDRNKLVKYII